MDTRKRSAILVLMLTLIALLVFPVQASAAAKLNKKKATVTVGKTVQLKVTGATGKVTWKSSKKSVATVNSSGKVKAKKKGTAVISAKLDGKTYKCTVTVKNKAVTKVTLNKTQYFLAPESNGTLPSTYTLKATVKPSDATNKKLTWTSSDKSVATVSSSGKVTAKKQGTAVITATSKDKKSIKATCTISVLQPSKKSTTSSTSTSTTVKNKTNTTGASAKAKKLLNLLAKYSAQVEADYAAGNPWGYGGQSACGTTFAEAAASTKSKLKNVNCSMLARWVLRDMGVITPKQNFYGDYGGKIHWGTNTINKVKVSVKTSVEKYCDIIYVGSKTPNQLLKEGKLLPGDICIWNESYRHTNIYAGDSLWYDAGRGVNYKNGSFKTFGPSKAINMSGTHISYIIRMR